MRNYPSIKFITSLICQDTDDDVLVWDLVSRFLAKSEIVRFENEANLKSGLNSLGKQYYDLF